MISEGSPLSHKCFYAVDMSPTDGLSYGHMMLYVQSLDIRTMYPSGEIIYVEVKE